MKFAHAVASLALLSLTSMTPTVASAQDAGWYIGGSVGQSQFDIDTADLTAVGFTGITTDDSDTAIKIFGGYQFNKTWAVEVGYVDFGSAGLKFSFLGLPFTGNVDLTAVTAAAVGTMPLNGNFSLFGKAGIYMWEADATVSVLGLSAAASTDGTDLMVGIGARYNLNKNIAVQAEFEHFAGDDTIKVFSIGLRYKF